MSNVGLLQRCAIIQPANEKSAASQSLLQANKPMRHTLGDTIRPIRGTRAAAAAAAAVGGTRRG